MLATDYRVPHTVAARAVANEVVLLDLAAGTFFSLNPTAALAWEYLAAGESRDSIAAVMAERFEVAISEAAADVDALAAELEASGLLERV